MSKVESETETEKQQQTKTSIASVRTLFADLVKITYSLS